jgi:hypothetical protein
MDVLISPAHVEWRSRGGVGYTPIKTLDRYEVIKDRDTRAHLDTYDKFGYYARALSPPVPRR